ncbi:hypothetical protein GWI33_017762 [Rhynchophorus ferrugineus]|uniref:MICOS complex subunit MIC13 n=1 Tax=Rhynchophorus ferrugineus TaxID=354439 RepID=A0A834M245_RHYFE|nr:hypothetical protein GWI33_017762 [Rhynchophorus ferrugineus]
MIKFAIKAAIAGTAVYYVNEQGIWNKSEESIQSYKRLRTAVDPYIQEVTKQIPVELPEIPQTDNVPQLVKLPNYTVEYSNKAVDALLANDEIKKFVDSFCSEPKSAVAKPGDK